MELSSDATKLITMLYKDYLEKRKSGIAKSQAIAFGSSHDIHERLCPDWIFEDVDDTCRELSLANLLDCFWADSIAYDVNLSQNGITFMENKFKGNLVAVTKFLADLISNFIFQRFP